MIAQHPEHSKVVAFVAKGAKKAVAAFDGNPPDALPEVANSSQSPLINKAIRKEQHKQLRDLQAKWLAYNNIPHLFTQVPEFAQMFQVYDKTFKPIARQTFIDQLDKIFSNMVDGIIKLVTPNQKDFQGMKWLSICHDMWNSVLMDGILGSSLRVTTRAMKRYTIAAILEKNNESHRSKAVADQLQKSYLDRYNINLEKEGGYINSDTCKAAANVADEVGAEQQDCEMHVVNLCLGYGLGVKENTKSRRVNDGEGGAVTKVHSIVTKGGPFLDGARICKVARKVVNFFTASPQRKEKLEKQRTAMDMPKIALKNYPDTRVSCVVFLYQSLLVNFPLLTVLDLSLDSKDDFKKLWKALSPVDISAMQEMEAVTQLLFAYSTNEAQQSSAFNNSLIPIFRKAMKAALLCDTYEVMVLTK